MVWSLVGFDRWSGPRSNCSSVQPELMRKLRSPRSRHTLDPRVLTRTLARPVFGFGRARLDGTLADVACGTTASDAARLCLGHHLRQVTACGECDGVFDGQRVIVPKDGLVEWLLAEEVVLSCPA